MAAKKLEWIKAASMVVGSVATAAKAVLDYRKFKHHQEKLEYTRNLQRKAWEQVMHGELSEAKIDDVTIKAPKSTKKKKSKPAKSPTGDVSTAVGVDDDAPTNGKKNGAMATPVAVVDDPASNPTEGSTGDNEEMDSPQDAV